MQLRYDKFEKKRLGELADFARIHDKNERLFEEHMLRHRDQSKYTFDNWAPDLEIEIRGKTKPKTAKSKFR